MSSYTVDQYEPNFEGTLELENDYRCRYAEYKHLKHKKQCSMMNLVMYKKEAGVLMHYKTPYETKKLEHIKSLYLDEIGRMNVVMEQIRACQVDLKALRNIMDTRKVVPEYFAASAAQAQMREELPDFKAE